MKSASLTHKLIKKMSYSAILMALSIILTRYASVYVLNWIRIGFGSIPIVIASLICGPLWGGLVGAGADVIGFFIQAPGPYFIGYTVDAALEGILPYCVMYLLKGRTKWQSVTALVLAGLMTALATSFVFMFTVYKKTEIPSWLRICIPFFFLLYFIAVFVIFFVFDKTKAFKRAPREERKVSLLDVYILCMVNECFISIGLLGIWNQILYQLNYVYSAFTQMLIFSINGLIRTIVIYLVINALLKADNSICLIPPSLKKGTPDKSAYVSSNDSDLGMKKEQSGDIGAQVDKENDKLS